MSLLLSYQRICHNQLIQVSVPVTQLHRDKVLNQEINPWDDPVCSCEAEPRWLLFQQEGLAGPGEWEGLDRPPSEEL